MGASSLRHLFRAIPCASLYRCAAYDGTVGFDNVSVGAVPRVIGRVDFTGVVERMATVTTAFTTDNFRSVCAFNDVTGYFVSEVG